MTEAMPIVIVSYGMGDNSTAELCGMVERKWPPPHAILSADTGGEKTHTYAFRDMFSRWLVAHGYPAVTVVKAPNTTLEEDCLRRRALPSVVYGYKSCSQRFKLEPQEKWANNDPVCQSVWAEQGTVTRLIGYHADEPQRAILSPDPKYTNRYPLIEWGWGQEECLAAIERAGLPRPGKSACFFCPNSRPREIRELHRTYPELAQRALAMEANAELTTIKGLGRNFSWRDVLNQWEMFPEMYDREKAMPCGCYDGEAA